MNHIKVVCTYCKEQLLSMPCLPDVTEVTVEHDCAHRYNNTSQTNNKPSFEFTYTEEQKKNG